MAEEDKKNVGEEDSRPLQNGDAKSSDGSGKDSAAPATEDSAAPEAGEDAKKTEAPAKPAEPDWKDLYARLKADFDNYKKRAARDRDDVYRYAESDILGDILPTVDNLALALANAKDQEDPFVKGVKLAYDTLLKALKDHGAEPFDSVGNELDTEKMEAITMMPSADIAEGKVVAEAKRGWTLKGKTLRAAQVVVSSGKPQ